MAYKLRCLSNRLLLASMCKLVASYTYHDFWVNHMHYINQQAAPAAGVPLQLVANKKILIYHLA